MKAPLAALLSSLLLLAIAACDDAPETVEPQTTPTPTATGEDIPEAVAPEPTPTAEPSPVALSPAPSAVTPSPTPVVAPLGADGETEGGEPANEAAAVEGDSTGPEYFTGNIKPCAPIEGYDGDPCAGIPGEFIGAPWIGSAPFLGDTLITMQEHLESYLSRETHFVVRGTFKPNTVRCTDDNPDRDPAYTDWEGGWGTHILQCFIDVRVNSYILGSGPSELTVEIWFEGYWPGWLVADLPEAERTWAKAKERALQWRYNYEALMEYGAPGDGQVPDRRQIAGLEVILFVGTSANHATESWGIVGQWDIETRDDGIVIAVHNARDQWKRLDPDGYTTHQAQLEMTIPAFTTQVTTAHQARVAEYGGRIAPADAKGKKAGATLPMLETDANRLTQLYTDSGAYAHEDGPPEPAPPACGTISGLSGRANAGLRGDCTALLSSENTLKGTGALNWDTSTAIASWDGITTSGTPKRVTKLELSSESLTGSIPYRVGDLTGLTHLDLSDNTLTGEIPFTLTYLDHLVSLKLAGNTFTGCIPVALRDVPTNDLASLNLSYCAASEDDASEGEGSES